MTYNGWTNYETWAVGMFLDGNYDGEGTYLEVLEISRGYFDADEKEGDVYGLQEALKSFVEERLPEVDGIAGDLLGAALSEVDWQELAEHKLGEIKEEVER